MKTVEYLENLYNHIQQVYYYQAGEADSYPWNLLTRVKFPGSSNQEAFIWILASICYTGFEAAGGITIHLSLDL